MPIAVRAFAPPPAKPRRRLEPIAQGATPAKPTPPSDWTLVFDTETTVDAAQRLRIGAYQFRNGNELDEAGLFYEPAIVRGEELTCFARLCSECGHKLRTVGGIRGRSALCPGLRPSRFDRWLQSTIRYLAIGDQTRLGSRQGDARRLHVQALSALVAAGGSGATPQCLRLTDPVHPSAEAAGPSWTAQAEDRAPQPARLLHRFEDHRRGAAQPIVFARFARRLPQDANAQSRKRRTWEAADGRNMSATCCRTFKSPGSATRACGIDTRCTRLMIRRLARFSAKRALAKPISNKWACGPSARFSPIFRRT